MPVEPASLNEGHDTQSWRSGLPLQPELQNLGPWSLPLPEYDVNRRNALKIECKPARISSDVPPQWSGGGVQGIRVESSTASTISEWSSLGPTRFDDPEILEARAALLKALLSFARAGLRTPTFERLQSRLTTLLDPGEWEKNDRLPNFGSFNIMLNFLIAHPDFGVPFVALLGSGNFELSWRRVDGRLTTIEFREDGWVQWLVFAKLEQPGAPRERDGGLCKLADMMSRLEHHGALDLIAGG
jgi:hypothetical protein